MQVEFGLHNGHALADNGRGRQLERMNFAAAAEAHVAWKNRLGQHVYGTSTEPLGAASLGQDGVCQLGTLLHGRACDSLFTAEECGQLKEEHALFHQLSAEVVERLMANDREAAVSLFENDYSAVLCSLLQSLSRMNQQ
ncbi:MAG: CZB domain-containing protein [Gallionella sp.]|nr:CZB domain-containing protein [Gallionella sp.]MDD4945672.1 CZB domain-containing protein [Gallionella sp.]MDD5611638.1 CZB domain-containing protein [Gallionella sp.]